MYTGDALVYEAIRACRMPSSESEQNSHNDKESKRTAEGVSPSSFKVFEKSACVNVFLSRRMSVRKCIHSCPRDEPREALSERQRARVYACVLRSDEVGYCLESCNSKR